MSRKERIVAAIRFAIAAGAPARRGLAERLLAGVLLAVAVAGAVLIPRLLVGTSPQHELGVGAPSMSGPPVVLAPGLPAQKSQAPAAANPRIHASHVSVVPSASASQPTAQGRQEPSPATRRPPAVQSPPSAQPEPDSSSQPTIRALTPTPLAPAAPTCDGTFSGTAKDVAVPNGATCVLTQGTAVTHDLTVSPGGTLIDTGVTVGHDLVAHSPAGISIDGGSVGHDLRIEGLSGSAGVQNRISNTTVGHDLVVTGNANAVALAGNSVGHALRVDGATAPPQEAPKPPTPSRPHPAPKPKLPKLPKQHEPKVPKPRHEPKLPEPPPPPKSHQHPKPHPEHPKPHPDQPNPHPDHPNPHPDHSKPQHTPTPEPVQEAEPHGNGNGHKP